MRPTALVMLVHPPPPLMLTAYVKASNNPIGEPRLIVLPERAVGFARAVQLVLEALLILDHELVGFCTLVHVLPDGLVMGVQVVILEIPSTYM